MGGRGGSEEQHGEGRTVLCDRDEGGSGHGGVLAHARTYDARMGIVLKGGAGRLRSWGWGFLRR